MDVNAALVVDTYKRVCTEYYIKSQDALGMTAVKALDLMSALLADSKFTQEATQRALESFNLERSLSEKYDKEREGLRIVVYGIMESLAATVKALSQRSMAGKEPIQPSPSPPAPESHLAVFSRLFALQQPDEASSTGSDASVPNVSIKTEAEEEAAAAASSIAAASHSTAAAAAAAAPAPSATASAAAVAGCSSARARVRSCNYSAVRSHNRAQPPLQCVLCTKIVHSAGSYLDHFSRTHGSLSKIKCRLLCECGRSFTYRDRQMTDHSKNCQLNIFTLVRDVQPGMQLPQL